MATKTNEHFIVILCGGTGPRLWPLSRANHPKQFLKLLDDKSLLEQTILRAKSIAKSENIFVISNIRSIKDIKKTVKGLIPKKNIIIEPQKKNTAMAILYATSVIKNINPDACITTFPSDHYVKDIGKFCRDLSTVCEVANNTSSIVTIGIKPTSPNPAYGYMLTKKTKQNYQKVVKFIEKPDIKTAQKLIQQNCYWNAGIYTFTISTIEKEFAKHQPNYFKLYNKLCTEIKRPKSIEKIYSLSENLAIDFAISQKSDNLVLVPAKFDWSDIGEWRTIYQQLKKNSQGNAQLKENTNFVEINSKKCLISGTSKKIIGLVGVDNLAIIDTPDALLICNLDQSFNVRDLVTKIVSDKKTENYFLKNNNDQK